MPASDIPQQETERKSLLDAKRNRKFQQNFRRDVMKQSQGDEEDDGVPQESAHKSRLAMLKAGAIKQANAVAGGAVGASVGGTVGSVIPVVGTGIGIFLGRFIGKKAGITGIIIFAFLSLLFLLVMFIVILKGYCDTWTGWGTNLLAWTATLGQTDICASLK